MTSNLKEFTASAGATVRDGENIYTLLQERVAKTPHETLFEFKSGASWELVTASEFQVRARNLASGLLALGLKKGDAIAVAASTSFEWVLLDFAGLMIGVLVVPIYETSSVAQISHILLDASVKYAFAGSADIMDKFVAANEKSNQVDNIFILDAKTLECLSAEADPRLSKAISEVRADDLATIVYTSGSTGNPKGVELTHRNFLSIVRNGMLGVPEVLMRPNARLLLFLPLAHVFARYLEYVAIAGTTTLGISNDIKTLLTDLSAFKPTYILGVPRIFEKVYNATSQKAGTGVAGRIFSRAAKTAVDASKSANSKFRGQTVAPKVNKLYSALIYSKIKHALGGNVEFLISGGAPIDADLAHFFNGAGLTILEGYGLTETAAPAFVNRGKLNNIGTVGQPLPGISVRIDETSNEIQIKSESVTPGYHNLPEANKSLFTTDGWLRSGDIGELNEYGFLKITGREKDIIVTAGGKNVSPSPLEELIKTSPIIANAVVVGERRPFISAILTFDAENLKYFLKSNKLDDSLTAREATKQPLVQAEIERVIVKANATVSRAESIRKFIVLDEDFSEENGQLTASMKVRRNEVLRINEKKIDKEIYGV
ncbi:MAG: AMP-dependent synthetase/ligase [Candidatus Ancillula sp.]|jgi:long-chain acyl-CoA synthetase|nr:AMP-dependent synthetase/ligase [Candidatus Ancillula sp.]